MYNCVEMYSDIKIKKIFNLFKRKNIHAFSVFYLSVYCSLKSFILWKKKYMLTPHITSWYDAYIVYEHFTLVFFCRQWLGHMLVFLLKNINYVISMEV